MRSQTIFSALASCALLLAGHASAYQPQAGTLAARAAPTPAPVGGAANLERRQGSAPVTTTLRLDGTLTVMTIQPSPTAGVGCALHIDHWDCESYTDGTAAEDAHAGHDHSGHDHSGHSHEGHSHAGHSHGPSEEYGCGLAPLGDYDLGLHVGALFILLAVSALGVFLPIVLRYRATGSSAGPDDKPRGLVARIFSEAFFVLKHAGYGIIVSVAFVHLLIHAFIYLTNECAQPIVYEAAPAAITMGGVLFVFIIDYLLLHSVRRKAMLAEDAAGISRGHGHGHGSMDSPTVEGKEMLASGDSNILSDDESVSEELRRAKAHVRAYETYVFEFSILLHSVVIGVSLGAGTGAGWSTLLIAVVFHQIFEGLALGARIAELPRLSAGPIKKFIMAAAFSLITPVGIAIGIGARSSWNPNDRSTLLALGILQSISAGALLWSALVEMIAGDYLYGPLARASLARGIVGIVSLLIGAMLMAVLAQWA